MENPQSVSISRAIESAEAVESNFSEIHLQVRKNAVVGSVNADNLSRQLKDAESLTRLAEGELKSKRIVVRWYRGVVSALRQYPAIIQKTGNGIKATVDVVEPVVDWWHHFKHGLYKAALDGFRDLGNALEKIGNQLEQGQQTSGIGISSSNVEDNYWPKQKIKDYFLEGKKIPPHIAESVTDLSFGNVSVRLKSLEGISQFSNLRTLGLSNTRVSTLEHLASLTQLRALDISGSHLKSLVSLPHLPHLERIMAWGAWQLQDIGSLSKQTSLRRIYLSNTAVVDISALREIHGLTSLHLDKTNISDLAIFEKSPNLRDLGIGETKIVDFAPLAMMTKLETLRLNSTSIHELNVLARLESLTSLDISTTSVADISPLLSLSMLEYLDIADTEIKDVAPLSAMPSIKTLYYSGRVQNLAVMRRAGTRVHRKARY